MMQDVRRRAGEIEGPLAWVTMASWVVRLGGSLVVNAIAVRRDTRARRPPTLTIGGDGVFSWLDFKLGFRMLVRLSAVQALLRSGAGGKASLQRLHEADALRDARAGAELQRIARNGFRSGGA